MKSLSEAASIKMTAFISKNNPQKSETELCEIKYGLNVLFSSLFKVPILIIIACLLGILKYVLCGMLALVCLKTFASGVHAKNSYLCLIISTSLYIGITYLSIYTKTSLWLIICIYTIDLFIAFLFAPADTEKRPILKAKTRKKLKLESMIVLLLFFALCIFFYLKYNTKYNVYINIIAFSLSAECFFTTPFAYKLMKGGYKNYEKYS